MKKKSTLLKSKTYKPFYYDWAIDKAKTHENVHWVETEVPLKEDVDQWKSGNNTSKTIKLTEIEKAHIHNILKLFTQLDVAVADNYTEFLLPVFQNNQIRQMLLSFAARETIHQRAYALLNDTLGLPESDYHAFLEYQVMGDKVENMIDNDTSTHEGIALAIAKAVFNEGVSLFAAFAMLLNYKQRGKMLGMCKIVEWSIRDETIHCEGLIQLFKAFIHDDCPPKFLSKELKSKIYTISDKMMELEDKFIDLAYELGEVEGLSKEDMKLYMRYLANRRLAQLGLKTLYDVKENPLEWFDLLMNSINHTNFFEAKVSDYSVVGMTGEFEYPKEI